jgi:anti-sigma B factor antagonist
MSEAGDVVPAEEHLAQGHEGLLIVALPGEIDMSNSPQVRATLLAAIGRHPAMVIADMTATSFCDSSGMGALVYAYRQAVTAGADMRLVIGHPSVRRLFALSGIETVIGIYPDLPGALSI